MIRIIVFLLISALVSQAELLSAQNECDKVDGLSVSNITEVSAELSWNGAPEHTSYTVDVMHGAQTSNFKFSTTTNHTTATVDGLQAGSNYRFRVKSKCDKGSGGSSKWFDFTTTGDKPDDGSGSDGPGKKCPELSGLVAINIDDTSATLSWQGDEAYQKFEVDVMHAPQNPNFKWSTTTEDTAVLVDNLAPGRTYRYKIKASCSKGKSNSKWHTFTTTGIDSTGHGRCPKATNLAVLDVTDTSVVLSWLGNPENVSYQVDVHQKEHTPQFRLSETTDTTALKVDSLTPGGNYKFRVKASCDKNSAGSSSWINFVTTGGDSTFNQCPKPRNLSVLEVSDTSALLSWVARDSVISFDLEIKSFEGTPNYQFDTTLTDTFYLVDNLSPEGNYQFRLKANCTDTSSSGSSDWSKFRTLADTSSTDHEIPTEIVSESSVTTFPNPAESEFNIQLPIEKLGSLTMVTLADLQGRVVYHKKFDSVPSEANLTLDANLLTSGIYKLVVKSINFYDSKTIFIE